MFKPWHVLLYFSNLVFFLNCFRITPFINTALYLANIGSFFGLVIILLLNPDGIYLNFKNWFHVSKGIFNAALVVFHLLPVVLFRERQTLSETFAPNIIATVAGAFLVYFALNRELPNLYGLSAETLGKLAVFLFFMFLGVHVLFFWK